MPDKKLEELETEITKLNQQQKLLICVCRELLLAIMASSPDQPIPEKMKYSLDILLAEKSELATLFNDDSFWLRLDELCRDRL